MNKSLIYPPSHACVVWETVLLLTPAACLSSVCHVSAVGPAGPTNDDALASPLHTMRRTLHVSQGTVSIILVLKYSKCHTLWSYS